MDLESGPSQVDKEFVAKTTGGPEASQLLNQEKQNYEDSYKALEQMVDNAGIASALDPRYDQSVDLLRAAQEAKNDLIRAFDVMAQQGTKTPSAEAQDARGRYDQAAEQLRTLMSQR